MGALASLMDGEASKFCIFSRKISAVRWRPSLSGPLDYLRSCPASVTERDGAVEGAGRGGERSTKNTCCGLLSCAEIDCPGRDCGHFLCICLRFFFATQGEGGRRVKVFFERNHRNLSDVRYLSVEKSSSGKTDFSCTKSEKRDLGDFY